MDAIQEAQCPDLARFNDDDVDDAMGHDGDVVGQCVPLFIIVPTHEKGCLAVGFRCDE